LVLRQLRDTARMGAAEPRGGERVSLSPYYADDAVTLHHGDCLDVLRELPDASVDAIVTDPPYALNFMGRKWDRFDNGDPFICEECGNDDASQGYRLCLDCLERADEEDLRGAAMLGQQSQNWHAKATHSRGYADNNNVAFGRWCRLWTAECLRVLKPGGHLLAFGGTRTWHRLACAVEDAGFEVRDSIAWLYGSGFPKSLDVSKAIDKVRDDRAAIRAVCRWLRQRIEEHPTETVQTLALRFGFHPRMVEHWAARDSDSQPSLPTLTQWDQLRDALAFDDSIDAEVLRLNLRKGEPGEAWAERRVTGQVQEWTDRTNYALTSRDGLRRDEPASEAACAWRGWGTALKPAFEPIVVGRKLPAGTVAANVLTHGTGALNIDGCRVGDDGGTAGAGVGPQGDIYGDGLNGSFGRPVPGLGRWPTNVVLDDMQAVELDRQSGLLTSGANPTRRGSDKFRDAYGEFTGQEQCVAHRGADSGGASRFFPTFRYEAKAPTIERPRDGDVAHPTVKPLDLMRWLVRLVTPPRTVSCENGCHGTAPQGGASGLSDVRKDAQAEGQQSASAFLLEGVRERGHAQDGRAEDVPHLFAELHADENGQPGRDVLLAGVWGEGERAGEAEVAGEDGEGLLGGFASRAPDGEPLRVRPRAPAGDGRAPGADARRGRSGAPHQRREDGQPAGEPGRPAEARARPHPEAAAEADRVPSLRGFDRRVGTCPECAGALVERGGVCLDPFAGSGTTAEACVIEGFRCIAIEREATYLPLIVARLSKPIQPDLFGGVA
jgi:DNA modification methylase